MFLGKNSMWNLRQMELVVLISVKWCFCLEVNPKRKKNTNLF